MLTVFASIDNYFRSRQTYVQVRPMTAFVSQTLFARWRQLVLLWRWSGTIVRTQRVTH